MTESTKAIEQTKYWLEKVVLELNFCPFAHKPFKENSIRYAVANTSNKAEVLQQLVVECQLLDEQQELATTLLVLPKGFESFDQYLYLLETAESLLISMNYEGVYQLASFHPDYCFADVAADDVSNFTNRSPLPILHILREQMLSDAIEGGDGRGYDTSQIPDNNIAQCYANGRAYFQAILDKGK